MSELPVASGSLKGKFSRLGREIFLLEKAVLRCCGLDSSLADKAGDVCSLCPTCRLLSEAIRGKFGCII